tara:strand:- start:655 stop:1413 length:759 start_codon:yes stop_codon:yes gene_type:complete
MADRIIKPDSGNDVVLQNNGGGTKIEIPNSGDIAITGTIGSGTFNGTIGSNVTYSEGWEHIETISCPTNVDTVSFTGIFTNDYVAFDFEMAMRGADSNCDFFIQYLDASNNALTDNEYFATLRLWPSSQDAESIERHGNQTQGLLVKKVATSSSFGGFRGTMRVRNVSAPTLDGVDTDTGAYRPDLNFTGSGFLNSLYSYATNYVRYNIDKEANALMGIKIFIRDTSNFATTRNFASGSWITCFGLKGKSTT